MGEGIPGSLARVALRRLFALYLALSGAALFFPHRPESWPVHAAAHLAGIIILVQPGLVGAVVRGAVRRWPGPAGWVGDWYALAIMPLLYSELAVLNTAVHGGRYFDGWVQGWDAWLFGGQPAQEMAAAFPSLFLSEVLHAAYLSYYLIIFGPPVYLYLRRRIPDHQKMVFALMLAFFGHYLFFVYFPVQGPRYLFPAPSGDLSQGLAYRLTHILLEAGSSRGSAFPSSHVGVSVAQTVMVFLLWRKMAPAVAVATFGLAVGAVYGGFHYATDVLAGLVWGLFLVCVARRLALRLGRGGAREDLSAGAGSPRFPEVL